MPTYNEQMPMIDEIDAPPVTITVRDAIAALERNILATQETMLAPTPAAAWQETPGLIALARDFETWANVTTPVLPYDTQYRIWRQRRRQGLPRRYTLFSGTPEPIPGIWRDQYAAEDACAHLDGHVWRYFVVVERLHPRITIRNATTAD